MINLFIPLLSNLFAYYTRFLDECLQNKNMAFLYDAI